MSAKPVLQVEHLVIAAGSKRLVDGVSFTLAPGRCVGLVGESGSGKSLTARAILRLLPPGVTQTSGRVLMDGKDVGRFDERTLRHHRGGEVAMVFQDPSRALDPTMRIGRQIAEIVRRHDALRGSVLDERVRQLLTDVQIPDPDRRVRAYPHELSGGMRQRVMLAMALAGRPRVLLADEPTTALDVTVQAQIMELLVALRVEHDLAVLLVTHDLGLAAWYTDDLAVIRAGTVRERGATEAVFAAPVDRYTRALLDAAPRLPAANEVLQ